MNQTANKTEVQREVARLMAVRKIRREQAAAYVKSLTLDKLNSELRRHVCVEVSDLIDEIVRGLLQGDIVKPNGW